MPAVILHSGTASMGDYTPGTAVTAGDVVVIGEVPFVAHKDIAANQLGALGQGGGVYRGVPAQSQAGGARVWWDATAGKFTTVASTHKIFGFTTPMGSNGGTVEVAVVHQPDIA